MKFGKDWDSVLLAAAESGDIAAIKEALEEGADVDCTTPNDWTPLLVSVTGETEITELLLAHGANPNLASNRGYTPLMRAAGHGKELTVQILLAAGADATMRDLNNKTAEQLAREMGHRRCAELVAE